MPVQHHFSANQSVLNTVLTGRVDCSDMTDYWREIIREKRSPDSFIEQIDASRLGQLAASEQQIDEMVDSLMALHHCGYLGSVVLAENIGVLKVFQGMIDSQRKRFDRFGGYLFVCDNREDFELYIGDMKLFLSVKMDGEDPPAKAGE